jgi:hypothetical protein
MEYYQYYAATTGFKVNNRENYSANFDRLATYMNWDERNYQTQWKTFFTYVLQNDMPVCKHLSAQEFFDYFAYNFGFYYNTYDYHTAFEQLSESMNWDKEIRRIMKGYYEHPVKNDLDTLYSEKSLESLQDVIRFYELCDETLIPCTIPDCKKMLEKDLFANIYDFISGSTLRFENAERLAEYTFDSGKCFSREKAKKDMKYKCLLRHLL